MSIPAQHMDDTPDLCVILTTTSTEDEARELARGLLDAGLAACVQLSQIDSLYLWEGSMAEDPEIRLFIKTRRSLSTLAGEWIGRHHPYEVPQIVVLPAAAANAGYQEWLETVTATA